MFQEPKSYTNSDHFFYQAGDDLENVCTAPRDEEGVFKVVELRNGKINLVYIGYSPDDLFNEIVSGLHKDGNRRRQAWAAQVAKGKTDAFDVYWYVTGSPKQSQAEMLKEYLDQTGVLPLWNR